MAWVEILVLKPSTPKPWYIQLHETSWPFLIPCEGTYRLSMVSPHKGSGMRSFDVYCIDNLNNLSKKRFVVGDLRRNAIHLTPPLWHTNQYISKCTTARCRSQFSFYITYICIWIATYRISKLINWYIIFTDIFCLDILAMTIQVC